MAPRYEIAHTTEPPRLDGDVSRPPWSNAAVGTVEWYHPAGSGHAPRARFRLLSDGRALCVRYTVEDRWVRCVHREYQASVFEDSCCEIFLQPAGSAGYFNVETNAVGTMMVSYITKPVRTPKGFAGQTELGPEADREIERWTSIVPRAGGVIDPEIEEPVTWEMGLRIPFALLEAYSGTAVAGRSLAGGPVEGTAPARGSALTGAVWRGNVFKCSENSSHPHWGAWSPIGERLDYHQPEMFGELVFQ